MNEYKLVAPDIDALLRCFERGHLNSSVPAPELATAMEPVFCALKELAPLDADEEAKAIWLQVPRGTIDDYYSYEDMLEYGEVKSRKEYEARWQEEYPYETYWYRLVIVESFNREGSLSFRAIELGDKTIISADMDRQDTPEHKFSDEAAVILCGLITQAVPESMEKLRLGTYNQEVNERLPYWFRTGVIRRSILFERCPEWEEERYDNLPPETVDAFRRLLESGVNDEQKIGRIKRFTANEFFRACAIGYRALGYDCGDLSPAGLYLRYADRRDEGLTGTGYGLNEGPGIDFDDPEAWDGWYFGKRGGGHPWEVIRGGNSTHVDLFVRHDKHDLEYYLRLGRITEEEYSKRMEAAGYYFAIHGKHRPLEAVTFYVALSATGLPVILGDSDEILARFDGSDYVGIVPHHIVPKYCEEMFPASYGRVIDFMHVFDEDMDIIGDAIEWLPVVEAKLADAE